MKSARAEGRTILTEVESKRILFPYGIPLFQVGSDWRLDRIVAEILPTNVPMRQVCRRLGFTFDGESAATLKL